MWCDVLLSRCAEHVECFDNNIQHLNVCVNMYCMCSYIYMWLVCSHITCMWKQKKDGIGVWVSHWVGRTDLSGRGRDGELDGDASPVWQLHHTHMHTLSRMHIDTCCNPPKPTLTPHCRAVKAGMQKENETGGTYFSLEAVCVLAVLVRRKAVGGGGLQSVTSICGCAVSERG